MLLKIITNPRFKNAYKKRRHIKHKNPEDTVKSSKAKKKIK